MRNFLIQEIAKVLQDRLDKYTRSVASGQSQTIEEYKFAVGRIRGLEEAMSEMEAIERRYLSEDED